MCQEESVSVSVYRTRVKILELTLKTRSPVSHRLTARQLKHNHIVDNIPLFVKYINEKETSKTCIVLFCIIVYYAICIYVHCTDFARI